MGSLRCLWLWLCSSDSKLECFSMSFQWQFAYPPAICWGIPWPWPCGGPQGLMCHEVCLQVKIMPFVGYGLTWQFTTFVCRFLEQSYQHALHPVRFAAMTPKLTQANRQPYQWISSGCGDVKNANPRKYVSVIQLRVCFCHFMGSHMSWYLAASLCAAQGSLCRGPGPCGDLASSANRLRRRLCPGIWLACAPRALWISKTPVPLKQQPKGLLFVHCRTSPSLSPLSPVPTPKTPVPPPT